MNSPQPDTKTAQLTQSAVMPRHIGVIPDGNRRWAKQHGKNSLEGHKAGYATMHKLVDVAIERGIEVVTTYAFSTENWSRSQEEVGYLMKLLRQALAQDVKRYHAKNVRLRFLGSRSDLDSGLVKTIQEAERLTERNSAITLNICFNYGGRQSIVEAVQRLVERGATAADITEDTLGAALETAAQPAPDLIIRTSGEQRTSNFLVWEAAYSELYFADVLWPDFSAAELDKALAEYARRQRRFGA